MRVALLLVAAASCGKSSKEKPAKDDAAAPTKIANPREVKLVVLLVIDHLPSWTFTRDAGQLSGGLARLVRESVYFPEGALPYANTYTAPGHAAIATGAGPNVTGILANGWNRGRGNAYIAATADPAAPIYDLSAAAPSEPPFKLVEGVGASAVAMRVEGVADVLAREKPEARSIAIGLKQRAVVLMLGKKPTRAIWYEPAQRAMTTSTAYGEPPAWLLAFNRDNPIADRYKKSWTIDDPDFLRRYTGVEDDAAGESTGLGITPTFPHTVEESPAAGTVFRMMPESVDYLLDGARMAIAGEELGQRGARDLLAITISTHDYVGHFFGQESWERFDLLRRIDVSLGAFFADLDKLYGPEGYAVVLTSDHGAEPLVERSVAAGRAARRIMIPELTAAVEKGLVRVLGRGRWVAGYGANGVYLSDAFKKRRPKAQKQAIASVVRELSKVPDVALAAPTDELALACQDKENELRRFVCESIHLEESGEITAVPGRYCLFQAPAYTTGTSHGTPSSESRLVPILVRSPGLAPFRSEKRVSVYQVAPTLSELLGISPPNKAAAGALPLVVEPIKGAH